MTNNENVRLFTESEVKSRALASMKWTILAEISSRSIQPIITLVLARLLSPSVFGIVSIAMIAINFTQVFLDFGLGKTLIQQELDIERKANVIFWTNLILSIVLYLIVLVSSPFFSRFFHEPKVSSVLRVLCLQLILFSLTSVHQSLFLREFQFRKLFFVRFSLAIVPAFVSIPLAFFGYGVWALVSGYLAEGVAQVFLYWKVSPWKPLLRYDFQIARKLFGFSSWVFLEAMLGWSFLSGDSIALGHYLGANELGVFRVGMSFVLLVLGMMSRPINPVAYSSFSRLQYDINALRESLLKLIRLTATVVFPIGAGFVVTAQSISVVVFGQKWVGIDTVISMLGLLHAITWILGINTEAYRAIGRPDINSKLLLILITSNLPIYIFAAPQGIFVYCIVSLLVNGLCTLSIYLFLTYRIFKISPSLLWSCVRNPLFASMVMGFIVACMIRYAFSWHFGNGWPQLICTVLIGMMIYTGVIWSLDRTFTTHAFGILKRAVT